MQIKHLGSKSVFATFAALTTIYLAYAPLKNRYLNYNGYCAETERKFSDAEVLEIAAKAGYYYLESAHKQAKKIAPTRVYSSIHELDDFTQINIDCCKILTEFTPDVKLYFDDRNIFELSSGDYFKTVSFVFNSLEDQEILKLSKFPPNVNISVSNCGKTSLSGVYGKTGAQE